MGRARLPARAISADDELAALAESIAASGLIQPISLDAQGRLVDGRNRLAACTLADVEPDFLVNPWLKSDVEIAEFINLRNAQRRNVSTGQKAMAVAEQMAAQGKRKNGRWQRGSVIQESVLRDDRRDWIESMRLAGLVIDYAPGLASDVIFGALTLNEAFRQAELLRDEKQAAADANRIAREQLADLRDNRPDLADLVDAKKLPLSDALTIREKETAAQRKAEADEDEVCRWLPDFCKPE